jgi:hypothetical protein
LDHPIGIGNEHEWNGINSVATVKIGIFSSFKLLDRDRPFGTGIKMHCF